MKVEMIRVEDIHPYAKNTKKHTNEQVTQIANSIREFGFQQPLVIDAENTLVIGHGRLKASKRLGLSEVPCIRVTALSESQIKALRIVDNKTNESKWDDKLLNLELGSILDLDMGDFGFDLSVDEDPDVDNVEAEEEDYRDPSCQHNVFENQEIMQFLSESKWGIPSIAPTQTVGDKMLRFMDWRECDHPEEYIAHFFYDDYKFMSAWRDPNKYIDRLRKFKAIVSPDFSLYTDFPRALQILSCYRRQWCAAYWQMKGLDIIPDVVWGVVSRITRSGVRVRYNEVPQNEHLADNQKEGLRCGDNGIFKGCIATTEQKELSKYARKLYQQIPYDGKYVLDKCSKRLIVCQSHLEPQNATQLMAIYSHDNDYNVLVNPLGYWTGGVNVDTGATNRKLGSDMGDAVTGGGLHGKDLSKADVTVNIYAHLAANNNDQDVEYSCAIGDSEIAGIPFEHMVKVARDYINSIGGFEKFAEWGLI